MNAQDLRALRLRLGLTQQELAERLFLKNAQSIYYMEHGDRPIMPQTAELARQLGETVK